MQCMNRFGLIIGLLTLKICFVARELQAECITTPAKKFLETTDFSNASQTNAAAINGKCYGKQQIEEVTCVNKANPLPGEFVPGLTCLDGDDHLAVFCSDKAKMIVICNSGCSRKASCNGKQVDLRLGKHICSNWDNNEQWMCDFNLPLNRPCATVKVKDQLGSREMVLLSAASGEAKVIHTFLTNKPIPVVERSFVKLSSGQTKLFYKLDVGEHEGWSEASNYQCWNL